MIPPILDTDLITLKEVVRSVGLKKSWIYDKISKGEFPRPKKLGTSSRWLRGEVEAWKKQFL
ncbi:AlpA family phage regulatory protein [Candidatus Sodalis endolongispinus]|uniref:AlpA family phage regulatory protein n=1 Tax=Candidatus Sodalis endolongispinus TaxID=2812662 RepID=A0ABS5Y9G7_9GAMM|nr:AlpA family phage regulatory protein [Candidatus Sodalis endolongispinus]MBT9431648.1 AlpA family phage regulatory protein [Candidatus Sodalis endolongispinus]